MISGLHTLSYGRAMVVMPPKSDAFHVKWVSFHTWLSQQFTVKIWFFSSTSDKKRERLSCCCLDREASEGVRAIEEAFACKNEEQIVLLPKNENKRASTWHDLGSKMPPLLKLLLLHFSVF